MVDQQLADRRCYYVGIGDALARSTPNPVRPIDALAVMAIIDAGLVSSRIHAAVTLPLSREEVLDWHGGRCTPRSQA